MDKSIMSLGLRQRLGNREGLPLAVAVHVRRVRGGQRGLETDGANRIYQPGEGGVKLIFLPPVSVTLGAPSWEAQPVPDSQTWE